MVLKSDTIPTRIVLRVRGTHPPVGIKYACEYPGVLVTFKAGVPLPLILTFLGIKMSLFRTRTSEIKREVIMMFFFLIYPFYPTFGLFYFLYKIQIKPLNPLWLKTSNLVQNKFSLFFRASLM